MYTQTDLAIVTMQIHHQNASRQKLRTRMKRAAEARHRIELLREEQVLHDHLADAWDEVLVEPGPRSC